MLCAGDWCPCFVNLEIIWPYANIKTFLKELFVAIYANIMSNPSNVDAVNRLMIVFIRYLELIGFLLDVIEFLYDFISRQIFTDFHVFKFHALFKKFLCFFSSEHSIFVDKGILTLALKIFLNKVKAL